MVDDDSENMSEDQRQAIRDYWLQFYRQKKFTTIWDPGLIFGSSGHLYDDNSPYDDAVNIDIADEFTAGIPEFSSIMMPIVSVLAIVSFNYRRRKINQDE